MIRFVLTAAATGLFLLGLCHCDGLPPGVLVPPEKNALPDYQGSSVKHQVVSVIWRMNLMDPGTISKEKHHHGSPGVSSDGSRVYAGGSDGSFHAFDSRTGKIAWRKLTKGAVDSEPTVSGDLVFVGSSDGTLNAFRVLDGERIWSYQTTGSVDGQPVVAGDLVLAMTDLNTLICVDAQTGEWRWSYRRDPPTGRFQIKGVSDPVVVGDRVFAGFADGFLAVLSLQDGSVQNLIKLSGKATNFTDVDTDPLVVEDTLVVGSFSGGLKALALDSLEEKWWYEVEGPSSVVARDGILYFSTANSKLVALDARTGSPLWIFKAHKGELSAPAVAGNYVLISSGEYSLLALRRSDGKLLQIFNPGKGSFSRPTVHGRRAYWISNGEILYAMSITP